MHFRIALFDAVLGRGRHCDQGRVANGSLAHHQAFAGRMRVDFIEDPARQVVLHEQVAELEQGRRVRCRLVREVDADKAADSLAVVDRILRCPRPTSRSTAARCTCAASAPDRRVDGRVPGSVATTISGGPGSRMASGLSRSATWSESIPQRVASAQHSGERRTTGEADALRGIGAPTPSFSGGLLT